MEERLSYYKMTSLISLGQASFTYEPNQLEIDAVVSDFYPIAVLKNFPESAEKGILEFSYNHQISDEVTLGFAVDTFEPSVYIPSELEVVEATEEDYEDIENCVEYIEVPIKNYIGLRNGEIRVNKHKLLLLAHDNYYGN